MSKISKEMQLAFDLLFNTSIADPQGIQCCPKPPAGAEWTEATQADAWYGYEIDCFYKVGSNTVSGSPGSGIHVDGGHWVEYIGGSYDCLGNGSPPSVCCWMPS
jgi:hypothetical protein